MNTWATVAGWILALITGYRFGRYRKRLRHETPFLHDTHGRAQYQMRDEHTPGLLIWDLDGETWQQADMPPWWHKCRAQTCTIHITGLSHYDRCSCGGARWGVFGRWTMRDSRALTLGSASGFSQASPL